MLHKFLSAVSTRIIPLFQAISINRQASRSYFVVHIRPSSIKKKTHIVLVHEAFPIHLYKLMLDFAGQMVLTLKIALVTTLISVECMDQSF
jgi:hypothetical protein